jgi:hypothetical protein
MTSQVDDLFAQSSHEISMDFNRSAVPVHTVCFQINGTVFKIFRMIDVPRIEVGPGSPYGREEGRNHTEQAGPLG